MCKLFENVRDCLVNNSFNGSPLKGGGVRARKFRDVHYIPKFFFEKKMEKKIF